MNTDSILIPPGMRAPCGRLLCTKICDICQSGALRSPFYRMVWRASTVRASRWSNSGELRGKAGLHAFWRFRGNVRPEICDQAVVHCLAEGHCRVGQLGLRAEQLTIQKIVLHPAVSDNMLRLVQLRYPDVKVCRARIGPGRVLTAYGDIFPLDKKGRFHGAKRFRDGTILRYRHGQRHGFSRNSDGSIERWYNGQRHGTWRYIDGRIERYRHGERHGLWILPDGGRIRYRHDLRHGTWKLADGSIERYYNGEKHGKWLLPNGDVVHYYYGQLREPNETNPATR
jgi:hypothetical protein